MRATTSFPAARLRALPAWCGASVLLLALASGCTPQLDTQYAAVRGPSINGVAAFVQLLRDTGHDTTARQRFPPRIAPTVRTVVVIDDAFQGLGAEAGDVLGRWLAEDGPRTALVVLRDSDAAIEYLRDVFAAGDLADDRRTIAAALLDAAEERLADATADPRTATPPFPDGLDPVPRPPAGPATIEVRELGDGSRRITARWPLRRRLQRGEGRTLWESGSDRLLVRQRVASAELLVLASAAPLLNGGLVDPGNRELAERLADLLPVDGPTLLVGSSRVAISRGTGDGDDDALGPWRVLTVQPLPWLAAQTLLALGLFCWCCAPIFGRPRRTSPHHAQDFAHHLDAVASLFAGAPEAGAAFSRDRLDAWRRLSADPAATPRRRRR